MLTLKGEHIFLRALEPEDLDFVHSVENDESIWEMSSTQTPYSKYVIKQYLENSHKDIYEVKQLRLAICLQETEATVGLIDLFDYDPANNRAGVGIVIKDKANRGKGFGKEALALLINYGKAHLHLHQLYANIAEDNQNSILLFEKSGFMKVGVKKEWNLVGDQYKDEFLYQFLYVH